MNLYEQGAGRIAWARQNMPLLAGLRVDFEREQPLAGRVIAMGLHVESKTAVLAELLVAGAEQLGRQAGVRLLSAIDGELPESLAVPGMIAVRASTGPAAS